VFTTEQFDGQLHFSLTFRCGVTYKWITNPFPAYTYTYRAIQEESAILWERIVCVILSKKSSCVYNWAIWWAATFSTNISVWCYV